MMFVCPRCGGDSVHDGPVLYRTTNGFKYLWTDRRFMRACNFMCWGRCSKCGHFFEVWPSRRDAKRIEKEMWKTDISVGKVKKQKD
jgi:hypothetical protein